MENPIDSPAASIIKSDRHGRTRYSQQYKQDVIDAFQSSSLSGPAFAKHCGIKYPTFAAWVARAKRSASPQSSAKPTFLIAELASATEAAPPLPALEARLPGGAILRAADSFQIKLLAELLQHLA